MNEINKQDIKNRRILIIGFIIIFFILLFYGFFKIQVYSADKYVQISFENSIRQITLYPTRGVIRDSYNRIMVDNRPSFLVSIIPRQFLKSQIAEFAVIIGEEEEYIREKIKGKNTFRPIIIKRDLDYLTLATLEEKKLDFPGMLIEPESKRYYPEYVNSPHIFGYVGEVNKKEANQNDLVDSGDLIGKAGLEYFYDVNLRGEKGVHYIGVDAEGRELGTVSDDRNIMPNSGMDLTLTMDYSLQQFAESLMVDHRGAMVALDTRNGGVIVFASKPDYDPRLLSGKISPQIWSELLNDPSQPLFSRVIQGAYPPGSTYKVVAALAALEEGIITPKWTAFCPGYFKLGRKTIHCWNEGGHGKLDLMGAIKQSCNVYFYQLGLKIGLDVWSKYSKLLYFGQPTGIDLPNENSGLVPSVEYFNKQFGPNGWTKGVLANLAIGQGELLTTPLQMAQLAMILATRGVLHTPHLTDYLINKQTGNKISVPVQTKYTHGISKKNYDIIRKAMRNVVDGGTGWRAGVYGIEVAGKTGTAQNPHGDDHAWFIGFAPYENPEIAIAIIIENGGGGGSVAAPLASLILEKYFYHNLLPRVIKKKDTTDFLLDSLLVPFEIPDIQPLEIVVEE
jgi:penicillin-binding protein 2